VVIDVVSWPFARLWGRPSPEAEGGALVAWLHAA